ncbi:hypothetical protein SAMN04489835_5290 [Mycolicibacterium rutilum]|uniref:Uncharacterized protein n=1 Tax=Mycolicibacterium rutilum TaxID=370526 RepID=A0A1H6LJC5_MYCRU|nr:hypothetical protein [Mycolicibacterium rutilum]SEH88669.1 hypothetical protein SAMN04489835_5290 [Mycolicibacterium rutilum]
MAVDHLATIVAYAGVAAAVTVWFWRTQGGDVRPVLHGVVAVVFGALWPVALPYRAAVRATLRVLARRRSENDRDNIPDTADQR